MRQDALASGLAAVAKRDSYDDLQEAVDRFEEWSKQDEKLNEIDMGLQADVLKQLHTRIAQVIE